MTAPLTLIRVCDVETTGLDEPCEMVEVGFTDIRLFPDGWAIERGPESFLVDPGMPIGFPAMAVHHITEDDVRGAVPADEARRVVQTGADILCAHNWKFDSRFIRSTLPAICTFKVARTVWPDLQSHGNGSIRYERGLCLGDERTQPSHRAGPDTWVTAHILLDLLQVMSVEEMIEVSGNPVLLTKITFGLHAGKRFSELPWDYLDWIVNKSKMPQDPTKEDVVHTARRELARRNGPSQQAENRSAPVDPDAWRKTVEPF